MGSLVYNQDGFNKIVNVLLYYILQFNPEINYVLVLTNCIHFIIYMYSLYLESMWVFLINCFTERLGVFFSSVN